MKAVQKRMAEKIVLAPELNHLLLAGGTEIECVLVVWMET